MRGRPNLHTSYAGETSMLPSWTQRVSIAVLVGLAVLLPFHLPVINQLPFIRFLGDEDWLRIVTQAVIFGIAALGLNLLSGVAGQVSLGHAFFMGTGAYAAVFLGGVSSKNLWGLGLPMWVWLPGAGICSALIGIIVSPAAVRVRGLYLGIVTIGLVFIGIHLSKVLPEMSGGAEVGRNFPEISLRWWKEERAVVSVGSDGHWLWFDVTKNQKTYLFMLAILILATIVSKNLIRSRTGRALQAIRDRDIAAEVMGVPEARYKLIAFAISSFFAGIAGALFASFVGKLPPEQFDLILSVEFIAILLIGGAGTTSGPLFGAFFVVLTPRFVEGFAEWMGEQAEGGGAFSSIWDLFVSVGANDRGLVSTTDIAPGLALPVSQLDALIYGVLIIVFLLFEPLGLYGIWVKIRNYWKGWPFSY
ncbi:MAG: branched-chain amino acid ABC transporter permease [Ilumatobacteraceae bacterium]